LKTGVSKLGKRKKLFFGEFYETRQKSQAQQIFENSD
jgi:hypothetical protein